MTRGNKFVKVLTVICLFLACVLIIPAQSSNAATDDKALKGKRVLIEGDSIQYTYGKYIEVAVKSMGAKKIKNTSKRAATIAMRPVGDTHNCVYWRISHLSGKELRKYDYIILASGTNDYFDHYKVKPGKVGSKDRSNTAGALNKVIQRIRKKAPKTKIVVVTPIHRWYKGRNCDKIKNQYGKTLKEYRKVITKVAKKYDNVYVIQGNSLSKAYEMKKGNGSKDGLHPSVSYAKKVLAKRFTAAFKATVLEPSEEPETEAVKAS